MESETKRHLDITEITEMTRRMFGPNVVIRDVTELTDGMFNAVYRMSIGPAVGDVVLKSSPPPDVALLTYERGIMRTEATFYQLAAQARPVPVPRVLATDFTRRHLDGDVLVMSRVNGRGWSHLRNAINDSDDARLRRDLGAIVGHLHGVTGSQFGYFQPAPRRVRPGARRSPAWSTTCWPTRNVSAFDCRLSVPSARCC